jgi:RNA-binding protein
VTVELTNRELRTLKGRAQLLRPMIFIGREGLSPALLKALDEALARHELVKVKFGEFKEQKKELVPVLAEKTASRVVMRVGNVAVLFRRKPPAPDA